MRLTLQPLLKIQRDLYKTPDAMARFQEYLRALTDGTQEMVLPLSLMNPMGKPHVVTRLDQLMELKAEEIATRALHATEQRLHFLNSEFRVALVLADDAGGGWTNYYLTDAKHRFEDPGRANDGWIVILLWTSESPTTEHIRVTVMGTVYRRLYQEPYGFPKTLQQMMDQEGFAARFAGAQSPTLEVEDLAYTHEVLKPYLQGNHFPTQFACWYGDRAAQSVGYPAIGLSANAGYAVALSEAQKSSVTPETMLLPKP